MAAVNDPSTSGEATIASHQKSSDAVTLIYSSWFCPYAQRAWIALEEKGGTVATVKLNPLLWLTVNPNPTAAVDYLWVEINPYERAAKEGEYTKKSLPLDRKQELYPAFVECCPKGLVPGIERGEARVWESLVCVEYIDEVGEGRRMPPSLSLRDDDLMFFSGPLTSASLAL